VGSAEGFNDESGAHIVVIHIFHELHFLLSKRFVNYSKACLLTSDTLDTEPRYSLCPDYLLRARPRWRLPGQNDTAKSIPVHYDSGNIRANEVASDVNRAVADRSPAYDQAGSLDLPPVPGAENKISHSP
jgi:hypothetical protein